MLATPPKLSVEIIAGKSLHIGQNVMNQERPAYAAASKMSVIQAPHDAVIRVYDLRGKPHEQCSPYVCKRACLRTVGTRNVTAMENEVVCRQVPQLQPTFKLAAR